MLKKEEDLSELRLINKDIFNVVLALIASFIYIYILNLKRKNLLSSSENQNVTSLDNSLKNIGIIALIISIKSILDDNYFIDMKNKRSLDDYSEYIASLFEIVGIVIKLKVFLTPSEDILIEFPAD